MLFIIRDLGSARHTKLYAKWLKNQCSKTRQIFPRNARLQKTRMPQGKHAITIIQ
jgi:hypothetical protein